MKQYRHEQILQLLSQRGNVEIADLAARFSATPMTIRRDLNELAAKSLLVRTHGGAMPTQQTADVDTPFHYRMSFSPEKKRAIAQIAKQYVVSGQKLFLSSGTTLHAFAKTISSISNLTIVTDAVNIAYDLAPCNNVTVVMLGGELRGTTISTTGSVAQQELATYNFDAAFLGVTSIDNDGQLYLGSIAELGIAQQLCSMTNNVFILADSTKLGKTDFIKIAHLKAGYTLVTDAGISPALADMYRTLGVRVCIAPV